MVENNSQKREENLKNVKKLVEEFEESVEVRRQKKLELKEEKDIRRMELPRRYMTKLLCRQENRKFKKKYLKKLKRNQVRWKGKDKKTERNNLERRKG